MSRKRALIDTDMEVHKFMLDYQDENFGIPPTVRDIIAGTIVSSTSHASSILNKLVDFGWAGKFTKGKAARSVVAFRSREEV